MKTSSTTKRSAITLSVQSNKNTKKVLNQQSSSIKLSPIKKVLKKNDCLADQDIQLAEALINSSVDGIFAFDLKQRLTAWNISMEYMTGLAKDQAIGVPVTKIFPFFRSSAKDALLKKALSGRTVISDEISYKIPQTNKTGYLEARLSPLFDRQGKVVGGLGIVRDITHHWETEEALKRTKEELELRVIERTAELNKTNQVLQKEVKEHLDSLRRINFDNALLKLFGEAENRKEYLDKVVRLIYQWTGCTCVGVRIKDSTNFIPYEAYRGFTREFWESENWLSLDTGQCACIRAIKGKFEPQDRACITKNGSFNCQNTSEFLKTLTKGDKKKV